MKRQKPRWIDPKALYSRQEIADRVGVSDDVLSFWIKRGLLVPEPQEGSGKGIHHRFHYSQLNIAVVLKAFREHFGANIAKLKSLADALQGSVRLFRSTKAEMNAWAPATRMANSLEQFRRGEPVKVNILDLETENFIEKIATTESEIIAFHLEVTDAHPGTVIQLANSLGPGKQTHQMMAAVMLGIPLEGTRYTGDYWLIRETENGWHITYDADDGTRDRSNIGPAVFLPIGPMLLNLWNLPSHNLRWTMDRAAQMRAALKDAGFPQVEIIVDQGQQEPQITWELNGASEEEVNKALLPYFGRGSASRDGDDRYRYMDVYADPSEYELGS